MRTFPSIGVEIPRLLLPEPGIDLTQWAVVACDQFTSQPEYWQQVAAQVGAAPSTFHLILPEVLLGKPEAEARLASIQAAMSSYLARGLLLPYEGLMQVERRVAGRTRNGLLLALDLEQYDYHPGSQTIIRSTEGTILERLPPRIKIRQGAPLEIPHILVLIDDPACSVIEPLVARRAEFKQVYDFDLMQGSGHLAGYFSADPGLERQTMAALEKLADPAAFRHKYQVGPDHQPLLFAMGDGNHSFATAKAIWEQIKATAGPDHPARYALVEIENVHDAGLVFEPIHRVLFGVNAGFQASMQAYWADRFHFTPCRDASQMVRTVDQPTSGSDQSFGVISAAGCGVVTLTHPDSNLPVGSLQPFLDQWQAAGGYAKIDYVHGQDVVTTLGVQPANLGFYLPAMPKSDLFKTVILDGVLPRKTFSMGEAIEKRFYMECRQIIP
jgi:hypothetical protein